MEKIAFLGLGTMGANITRKLLNRGYPLTVYTGPLNGLVSWKEPEQRLPGLPKTLRPTM